MIGVFDSGHGGLTVLRALRARLAAERFVYLGDHAHAPYGDRAPEEVLELTRQAAERLFDLGCRLVVLACNTAAATALRPLQQGWLAEAWPDRRLLGVLVPTVEAVTLQPWTLAAAQPRPAGPPRSVAVFATRGTVACGAYPREIGLRAPEVRVVQQACPALAGAIEQGRPEAELRRLVHGYVAELHERLQGWPDFAVLGCTHYPLVARHFRAALPEQVVIHDQPALCAESLAHYLERRPEFRSAAPGPARLFTTGDAARVSRGASLFMGEEMSFSPLTPAPLRHPRAGGGPGPSAPAPYPAAPGFPLSRE